MDRPGRTPGWPHTDAAPDPALRGSETSPDNLPHHLNGDCAGPVPLTSQRQIHPHGCFLLRLLVDTGFSSAAAVTLRSQKFQNRRNVDISVRTPVCFRSAAAFQATVGV